MVDKPIRRLTIQGETKGKEMITENRIKNLATGVYVVDNPHVKLLKSPADYSAYLQVSCTHEGKELVGLWGGIKPSSNYISRSLVPTIFSEEQWRDSMGTGETILCEGSFTLVVIKLPAPRTIMVRLLPYCASVDIDEEERLALDFFDKF